MSVSPSCLPLPSRSIGFKGHRVGESCLDLLVSDRLVVELKAVEALAPIHWGQVRSYLKATGRLLGLLINFNVPVLLRGVRRIILTPDLASWRLSERHRG